MINFFRKTHQKLLVESRLSKYILYTSGEVLLVVIGILIAVQIDAFISNRELQKNNKVFLNKIVAELELNKKRMTRLAFGNTLKNNGYISLEKAVANCDSLLKLSFKGLKENDTILLFAKLDAGGSFLNLHNSAHEELINTGRLYTLGSDELITAIKNYYKRCEREDLYNKSNINSMNDGFKLLRTNLDRLTFEYKYDSLEFSFKNYPWLFNKASEEYKDMQQGLIRMLKAQRTNLRSMKEIIQYSDSLIVVINKELND